MCTSDDHLLFLPIVQYATIVQMSPTQNGKVQSFMPRYLMSNVFVLFVLTVQFIWRLFDHFNNIGVNISYLCAGYIHIKCSGHGCTLHLYGFLSLPDAFPKLLSQFIL